MLHPSACCAPEDSALDIPQTLHATGIVAQLSDGFKMLIKSRHDRYMAMQGSSIKWGRKRFMHPSRRRG